MSTYFNQLSREAQIEKVASGPTSTIAASVLSPLNLALGLIPGAGAIPTLAGQGIGYFDGDADKDEKKRIPERSALWSLLPGVGPNQIARRMKGVAGESKALGNDSGQENSKLLSEYLGRFTAPLAAGAIGAGVGAGAGALGLAGEGDAGDGAVVGGATGIGVGILGSLVGSILAMSRKRRSAEEQAASTSGADIAKDYLLPGHADYDYWKRLGRSKEWDENAKDERDASRLAAKERKRTSLHDYTVRNVQE